MKRLGIFLVRAYQVTVGPLFAGACRFEPSCSNYGLQALDRFGLLRGSWLTLRRLLRCRPFGPHGYDPVPETWPGFFGRRLSFVAAIGLLATAVPARAVEPASPFELCSRLEARLAAGDGVLLPDAGSELVRFAGTIELSEGDWPSEFLARAGQSVFVAVSPETGFYEFFDENGTVFWTVVPVLPTTDNWIAPFRHAERGTHPDDDLYASWRLVDVWRLDHAEFAEFDSHAENAEQSGRDVPTARPPLRSGTAPDTMSAGLRFTAFSFTETNLFFTVVWPTNDPLPQATLDLYGSTNLVLSRWIFLSSHLATNPPASFSIPPETVPGWGSAVPHAHDATCPVATNLVLSPLDGTTVYTNVVYGCTPAPTPGEAAFFRLGTRLDTDGDGLPDAFETLVSLTDPSDPDTDGDGVPDGQTAATWAENPLWADSFDDANLVVFLYEPVTNGHAALRFDDLCIPLCSNAGPWMLTIPTNRLVQCELVSGADTEVFLWYGPPEACETVRSSQPLRPGWTVPPFVRRPLWCDHPSRVFGGNRGGGACRFASPVLVAGSADPSQLGSTDVCYHGLVGEERFYWAVLPVGCTGLSVWCDPPLSGGDVPGTVVLDTTDMGSAPGARVSGTLTAGGANGSFWDENILFGSLGATVSAHRGSLGGSVAWCNACGVFHIVGNASPGGNASCYHAAGCAALADSGDDCTCPPFFLRIGSRKTLNLVGEGGCCCWREEYEKHPEIVSASGNLDASLTNRTLFVEALGPSPTIGGSSVRYRIENDDGSLFRQDAARFTCADLGIEPDLSAAYRQFDWPSDDPAEYFLADATLCLARRTEPYPIRFWNESPADARLVCALDGPEDGPALRFTMTDLAGGASATNAAPFAALNDDRTVYLDASCSNALSVLSLTLSDPDTGERFLRESLTIRTVDTDIGEHWRVRSATDRLSWDFSDAPAPVWIGVGTPGPNGTLGTTLEWNQSLAPSLSLDLPPGDYLLEAYFPRLYAGSESGLAVTNVLHVRPVPEFVRDVIGVQYRTDRRVEVALTSDSFYPDVQWTLSPVVANGPRLFASSNSVSGASSMSGVSNVWVSAGTVPGIYDVTASYLGCTNAIATVYSIQVELDQMWETANPANTVFNSTPKDDTSDNGYQETDATDETTYGIHREKLYIASDSNDIYRISFRFSVTPVEATNFIVLSGRVGVNQCTDKFRLHSSTINISFPSFSSGTSLDLCKFRGAVEDSNEQPFFDSQDEIIFAVYEHPMSGEQLEPGLVGINQERQSWHNSKIQGLINHVVDPAPATSLMPHARALLTLFYDGNTNRIAPCLCPSSERTVALDAFGNAIEGADCYSEWLTHNSGAGFSPQGCATIKEYSWDANSEMSRFLATHKPFVLKKRHVNALDGFYETQTDTGSELKSFYINHVAPAARTFLVNSNNLATVTLPISGDGYSFPNPNSTLFTSMSPSWVPGATFLAGDGGSSKAGALAALFEEFFVNDDAFAEFEATGTIGRGRLYAPTYQFVIQRIDNPSAPDGFQCKTLAVHFSCRIEDLYDFNYEDGDLASHAAAIQIQRGNGAGGEHGIIFKDVFFIDYTYQNPFEMESGASIHSVGGETE